MQIHLVEKHFFLDRTTVVVDADLGNGSGHYKMYITVADTRVTNQFLQHLLLTVNKWDNAWINIASILRDTITHTRQYSTAANQAAIGLI